MRLRGLHVVLAGSLTAAIALLFACGTDPVGVDACQRIEKVRCESAQACGIDLGRPRHEGESAEDHVVACIRYYDDQCQHGLVTSQEPAPQAVDLCVNAIINGDCTVVQTPQAHPDCAFLIPPAAAPAPVVDASADAPADG